MALRNVKGWISKKDTDLWTGLFLMVLSGAIIREAIDLEVGNPNNPGSGFMIFGASGVLGLLALHQFIKSLRSFKHKQETAAEGIHWGRIVAVVAANLLYIFLLQPLGYLVCTFLFLSFLFQILERGRWVPRVIGSALTSFLTYVLFARLLQLNLPRGVIPFF
jgi:putative tricarboxylic transport membrane protein